mmetsp:Transcript_71291/g.192765  ORF Transcript_71291/g.192765 Transcript_71291/m.192765 type:complete len:281 (-) Transcript_71291:172-1014(-)
MLRQPCAHWSSQPTAARMRARAPLEVPPQVLIARLEHAEILQHAREAAGGVGHCGADEGALWGRAVHAGGLRTCALRARGAARHRARRIGLRAAGVLARRRTQLPCGIGGPAGVLVTRLPEHLDHHGLEALPRRGCAWACLRVPGQQEPEVLQEGRAVPKAPCVGCADHVVVARLHLSGDARPEYTEVVVLEKEAPRQQLEQQAPERPDVRGLAGADLLAAVVVEPPLVGDVVQLQHLGGLDYLGAPVFDVQVVVHGHHPGLTEVRQRHCRHLHLAVAEL